MSTADAHADTSSGEPLDPTMPERRDPSPHDAAKSGIRLLTRRGAMP
ncbi:MULTISPECIES: hypothetical protein [unclassified Streptomyces]